MNLAPLWRWPARAVAELVILAIRVYQVTLCPVLSVFGPMCRFEPTCSRYTIQAVRKYGVIKGLWKGVLRIGRCHPWHPGGLDPP